MNGCTRASMITWALGPCFLLVAAWLMLASPGPGIPEHEMRLVPKAQIAGGSLRHPLRTAAEAKVGTMMHACSECHRLFDNAGKDKPSMVQHTEIKMKHGMNTRCLNCHYGIDRDKLVLHDGTLIEFFEAPRLCSQCHGTVYRDWQKGTHGKTMGAWDPAHPDHVRLACNECHDPHAPAYEPIAPLPPPETLRMGDQSPSHEDHARSPLRHWSQPGSPMQEEHRP